MAIKAVELVRNIRDRNYEQTKKLSVEGQIEFVRAKSRRLQKELQKSKHPIAVGKSNKQQDD